MFLPEPYPQRPRRKHLSMFAVFALHWPEINAKASIPVDSPVINCTILGANVFDRLKVAPKATAGKVRWDWKLVCKASQGIEI